MVKSFVRVQQLKCYSFHSHMAQRWNELLARERKNGEVSRAKCAVHWKYQRFAWWRMATKRHCRHPKNIERTKTAYLKSPANSHASAKIIQLNGSNTAVGCVHACKMPKHFSVCIQTRLLFDEPTVFSLPFTVYQMWMAQFVSRSD